MLAWTALRSCTVPGWYPAPVVTPAESLRTALAALSVAFCACFSAVREGAVVRPGRRERGGHVELVFQRLAELDHVAVELREVLDPAGRLPLVDVALMVSAPSTAAVRRRDRDDGGQPPPDAPVDQGEPGPGRAGPPRVRVGGADHAGRRRGVRRAAWSAEPHQTRRPRTGLPSAGLPAARYPGDVHCGDDGFERRSASWPAGAGMPNRHLRRPLPPAALNLPRRLALR